MRNTRLVALLIAAGSMAVGSSCGLKLKGLNPTTSQVSSDSSGSEELVAEPDPYADLIQYTDTSFAHFTGERRDQITTDGLDSSNSDACALPSESLLLKASNAFSQFFAAVRSASPASIMRIRQSLATLLSEAALRGFALTVGNEVYYGIEEIPPRRYGAGILLIHRGYASLSTKLLFEVPHPLHDSNTPDLGGEVLDQLKPALYLQSGLHRNCSTGLTSETYPENYTSSQTYQKTDPAHESNSFFHTAHTAVANEASYVIQLHGFGAASYPSLYAAMPPVEVVISGGTSRAAPVPVTALKARFVSRGVEARSYPTDTTSLGARANVQGEHTRSVLGQKFVHIESRTELRATAAERQKIILSIQEAFP